MAFATCATVATTSWHLPSTPMPQHPAAGVGMPSVIFHPRTLTDGIPTPAAGCCGIGVDGRCQLVVATVAHVAKAVEMSVLGLDEPEPRVPKRVGPVQGLDQRRVDLTRAVCSDNRPLTKTLDSVPVPANKPGTRCSAEHTHLPHRRSFGPVRARDEFGKREEPARGRTVRREDRTSIMHGSPDRISLSRRPPLLFPRARAAVLRLQANRPPSPPSLSPGRSVR